MLIFVFYFKTIPMENIINQIIDIENKSKQNNITDFTRNFKRLHHEFENLGYKIINPLGGKYDYRDSAIEANIINKNSVIITKVLKPVIYKKDEEGFVLVQKGIVIVA